MNASQVIVFHDNRGSLLDPNIHTDWPKFLENMDNKRNADIIDAPGSSDEGWIQLEEEIPTQSEHAKFIQQDHKEIWNNFEQDFAVSSSVFMAVYENEKNELVKKYGPEIETRVIKEFQSALNEAHVNFDSAEEDLMVKIENEFFKEFPNGTDDPDVIARYEKKYLKEKKILYDKHYTILNDSINNRYSELLSHIPEINEFEAKKRTQFEEDSKAQWERYFDENSGLYNKWSKETLTEIANNYDKHNLSERNRQEKLQFLSKELAKRLNIMDKSETPFFTYDGEREEYISDYWHYFYKQLNWEENPLSDSDPQATHFLLKGMASELKDWTSQLEHPMRFIKHKSLKNPWSGVGHRKPIDLISASAFAWNLYIPNYDENGYMINKDKIGSYGEYGMTHEILDPLFEEGRDEGLTGDDLHNYVAYKYRDEIWPHIIKTERFAEDVLSNPESLRDMGHSEFAAGLTSHRWFEYIPVVSGLIDLGDDLAIKRIYDKARDCGGEDCLEDHERKLLAASSLLNQSDHLTSKISNWYNGGQFAGHSVSFVGEFILTGPAFKAASTATKVSMKTALATRLNAANKITKGGARYSKGKDVILFSKAKDGRKIWLSEKGIDSFAMFNGLVTQTAFRPWHIYSGASEMLTGEYAYAFSNLGDEAITEITAVTAFDEDGKKMGLKDTDKSFAEAWVRSFGVQFFETFTERLGYYLPGVPRRLLNKCKIKGTPIGDMLFDSDMYQKISMGWVMRKLGIKSGEELFEWAGINGGWSGILGDFSEEMINVPLQNIAIGDTKVWEGIYKYDKDGKNLGFDWDNIQTTAISVTGMGGMFTGLSTLNNIYKGNKSFTGWIGDHRYHTQEAFTRELNRLKKEGKLNKDLKIEIKNDYDLIDKTYKFLEKNGLKKEQLKVPDPKGKHKITANELEILSHEDLTDEQVSEIIDINKQLGELNNQSPSKENKNKKDKLNARRQEILEPLFNDIIKKKTTKH